VATGTKASLRAGNTKLSAITSPRRMEWPANPQRLVPFQLIAPNFGEPRGESLFEVTPSSPRLQVTFTSARVVRAQTTLIVDQSQRASIVRGTYLPLVMLPQALSQIACAADVEFSILLAQQDVGVFHRSPHDLAQKVGTALGNEPQAVLHRVTTTFLTTSTMSRVLRLKTTMCAPMIPR